MCTYTPCTDNKLKWFWDFQQVKWGLTDVSTHLVCCREISVPLGQLGMPDEVKSQIPFIRIPVYGSSLDVDLRTLPGNVQLRVWDDEQFV